MTTNHKNSLLQPALWLHLSFVVILLGATASFFTSKEGVLYLDEKPVDHYYDLSEMQELPISLALRSLETPRSKATGQPLDYVTHLIIYTPEGNAQDQVIAMNRIFTYNGWRFCLSSLDEDGQGVWLFVRYDPIGTPVTYIGYILLIVSCLFLFCKKRNENSANLQKNLGKQTAKNRFLGHNFWLLFKRPFLATAEFKQVWLCSSGLSKTLLGIAVSLGLVYAVAYFQKDDLLPVLRTRLLLVHVTIISAAYLLLLAVSLTAIFSRKRLPLAMKMLTPALLLLMIGIVTGAYWANISWGRYWSWDPKETAALVTLFIYAAPLHSRRLPFLNSDRRLRAYLSLALLTIIATYFGVNYIFGGMHAMY